jgi:subtilase family serine protease
MASNLCLGSDPIIIETRIFNRGMKSSPKARVSLRAGVRTLAQAGLPGLTPGQSHLIRLSWRPTETGTFRLHLVVDPDKELKEANENNNVTSFQVRLRDCRADLALTAINLRERMEAREEGRKVVVPVHNRGLKTSQPTTLTLKLNGREKATRELGRVEPGAKVTVEFPLEKLPPGRVVLEVEIDPQALGDELSRANNHLKRVIQVRSEELDLGLEKIWTEPEQPRAGQPYLVKILAVNLGAGVGEAEIAVKIDGLEAGRIKLPGMWPRATKEAGLRVAGSPAGERIIRAEMDPEGRIGELDEANNVLEKKVTVIP